MSTVTTSSNAPEIDYPDDDGLPMSDNTKQFGLITSIHGNLDAIYKDDPNVFVAGNLLWYPVRYSDASVAPDIFVALGRPKEYRGSYRQWLEGGIAPQVIFEILSPGNRAGKMVAKFQFYDEHGVEEYYVYDPDDGTLDGWRRIGGKLKAIAQMHGWVSPLLKIRFELQSGELLLFKPDGSKFMTYVEMEAAREEAQRLIDKLKAQLRALGVNPEA